MTIVAPCVIVLVGFLVSPWPAQRFLILYVAPLALVVLLWSRIRIENYLSTHSIVWIVDVLVLVFAFVRGLGVIPYSGHMLFIV